MNDFKVITAPLPAGKTTTIIHGALAAGETRTVNFTLDCDSVLIALYVDALASGTMDLTVYTQTEDGHETAIISFPTVTGPTAELLMRKAAVAMSVIKVVCVTTGAATVDIRAKGLTAGETSVKILGSADWSVSTASITTVASQVVPSGLSDRNGLVIKNFNSTGILYVAETSGKATSAAGYPIGPGESLAFDLVAGQEIWGVASSGTIDVRLAEAGG
jgi:hypothetical protein